jgi:YfiH family protein
MTVSLVPHGQPPRFFTFASLTALGLPHASTTRHFDGAAPFADPGGPFRLEGANGLAAVGIELGSAAYAKQIHAADIAIPPAGGFVGKADVLATRTRGLPLAIFTADCLAITLYDREASALTVAHVGWRGTVAGATAAAVAALTRVGGRPAHASAAIAPSIGPCCYEVDGPVIEQFAAQYPDAWDRWAIAAGPGHWMLDLWTANEDLLVSAGVPRTRIENPRLCTACNPDVLFSYRKGNRGRLVTVAALPVGGPDMAPKPPDAR